MRRLFRDIFAERPSAAMMPGATKEEMRTVRAAAADAETSNERVSVFATTPHKHTQILKKAPDAVVAAIEDVIHRSS